MTLSQPQLDVADLSKTLFLEGTAGTGKTTAALNRLRGMLESGLNGILVLVPQRTLALPYYDLLEDPRLAVGEGATITTLSGLARRAVDLFWPLIAESSGFRHPEQRPTFLSLETAQYHMARLVAPVIESEGLFDTISIDRNRLYSQLIDNLNKAAVVGFPHTDIADRLKRAWIGTDPAQPKIYEDGQRCANLFRAYCLEHNLLDFSLMMVLFMDVIGALPQYHTYFQQQYQHLIFDNIEEDTPAAHDFLRAVLPQMSSALLVYDTDAGYRRFLGADPGSAYSLKALCGTHITLRESFVTSPGLRAFGHELARSLNRVETSASDDPRTNLAYDNYKYHPEMIDGVAEQIASLVHNDGVDPAQIVVLSPYLSDALRFSLMNRLQSLNVPVRSHRPSRSLREEPASLVLLTLAQLAHPQWGIAPTAYDVVYALMESINALDLVRAQLLARHVFNTGEKQPRLEPFAQVTPSVQERITFVLGERYDRLRAWLLDYANSEPLPLDHFFSRLFGEVLSQPGFGFHDDYDAAEVTANLIDSARKFRQVIGESTVPLEGKTLAQEYVEMVGQGIIADQYLTSWEVQAEEAVLLAPAYTFLMSNRPVDYQFWLNVGGAGWAERLYQPLTNPYILSREWDENRKWTDLEEVIVSQEALYRLTVGLVRRCRRLIYLGFSELGEQGYEQRGELLTAVQKMLRRLSGEDNNGV
ncbi:MAG: hypothetical protein OHK0046_24080 [Anaerolineae bacterium]